MAFYLNIRVERDADYGRLPLLSQSPSPISGDDGGALVSAVFATNSCADGV